MQMNRLWDRVKTLVLRIYDKAKSMNPFAVAAIIFVAYILLPPLSGQYSIWNQIKTWHQLAQSRSEYETLKKDIETSRKDLEELQYHKDMLEKYAREEFLMKSEDEDLYLLR